MIGQILSSVTGPATPVAITRIVINTFCGDWLLMSVGMGILELGKPLKEVIVWLK